MTLTLVADRLHSAEIPDIIAMHEMRPSQDRAAEFRRVAKGMMFSAVMMKKAADALKSFAGVEFDINLPNFEDVKEEADDILASERADTADEES